MNHGRRVESRYKNGIGTVKRGVGKKPLPTTVLLLGLYSEVLKQIQRKSSIRGRSGA